MTLPESSHVASEYVEACLIIGEDPEGVQLYFRGKPRAGSI